MASVLAAYLVLLSSIYYETFYSSYGPTLFNIPITATIFDSLTSNKPGDSFGLCWYNPDSTLDRIIAQFPIDCNRLSPGITTNTYVGHQFIVMPFDESGHISSSKRKLYQIFAIQPNITSYDVRQLDVLHLSPSEPWYRLLKFHVGYSDMILMWQHAIIHRRIFCLYYALFLIIVCVLYMPAPSKAPPKGTVSSPNMPNSISDMEPTDTNISKVTGTDLHPQHHSHLGLIQDSLIIPRHALKSIAVVTMVLNHIGHNSLSSRGSGLTFKPYWTVLADAGWSSQVFCWLAGLNTSQVNKSSELVIVMAFVGLELFVRLPSPITYENLLTIATIRFLCCTDWLSVRSPGVSCKFADMHILFHAVLCCLTIQLLDKFLGADGLKVINISGVLYAMSGRIFAVNVGRGRSWNMSSKALLWHAAATYSEMTGINASWDSFEKHSVASYAYCGFFMCSLALQLVILNMSASKPNPNQYSFYLNALVARYSLEIYVSHFLLLLAYNQLH